MNRPFALRKPSARGPRPVIEHYADYRHFLRDMYAYQKGTRPEGYTFRQLAEDSGLKSGGFVNLVFSGRRNLDPEKASQLARALRLSEAETRFLRDLMAMNQAADVDERSKHLRLLVRRPKFREFFRVDEDMLDYLENWYVAAIHELAAIEPFHADPEWISRRMSPPVTASQAKDALETLLRLGLIEMDEQANVRRTVREVRTPDEFHHGAVRAYHAQAADLARWALNMVPPQQRNFGAVTATVRREDYPALLDFLHKQRHDMIAYLRELQSRGPAEMVAQVNYHAFPLTDAEKEGGAKKVEGEQERADD